MTQIPLRIMYCALEVCPHFHPRRGAFDKKLQNVQPTRFGQLYFERSVTTKTCHGKLILQLALKIPRYYGRYTTDTDACNEQVACAMF